MDAFDPMDSLYRRLENADRFKEHCDAAQRVFLGAETAARATGLSQRQYQVSYRLGKEETSAGISYDQRRGELVATIEALTPRFERHEATSTFWLLLHLPSAEAIAAYLSAPLDASLDFIEVVELTGNRGNFGQTHFR